MTKRTKILSTLCLFVLALFCAVGVFFNAGARSARAEALEDLPTVSTTNVLGRNITLTSTSAATAGTATCQHLIKPHTNPTNVAYAIIEWTNDEDGIPSYAGNTFMYGAGQTGAHGLTISSGSATAFEAVRGANANVKMYFNLQTGSVTAVVTTTDGEGASTSTAYELKPFTPVADYTTTATPIYLCFHSVASNQQLKDVKIYTSAGTDLKVWMGSKMSLTDVHVPTTAVSSSLEGNDYSATGGSKYISTAKPTSSEWIIFETTTVAGENVMEAGNNFYFGLSTTAGSANGTDTSVSDWSPITPLKNGGLVRYFLNTKTGNIYVSTSAIDQVPVLTALTQSGLPRYTTKNVGLDSVYGKIYFNSNVTTIDLNGLKVYDENGNNLGISTNLTLEIPEITNDTAKTINLYEGAGSNGFGSATATNAKWIIFEYTVGEKTVYTSAGNNLYAGLSTTKAKWTAAYLSDATSCGIISNVGKDIKIMVDTETGNVYFSVDGGAYTKMATSFASDADCQTAVDALYACFYFNVGVSAVHIENLKCYDSDGNDLGVVKHTDFTQYIEEPTVDTSLVPSQDFVSTGGDCTYFVTNEATTSEYIIFEWVNGVETGMSGGGNANFMGYGETSGQWGCTHNSGTLGSYYEMYNGLGKTVKIYLNTRTGEISYSKTDDFFEGWAKVMKTMTAVYDGNTSLYGGFCLHLKGNTAVFNNLKVYDGEGNALQYTYGGLTMVLPTVDATNVKPVELTSTGGTCTYIASAKGTTSEWIIFDWTNGVETAVSNTLGFGGSTYFSLSATQGNAHTINSAANGYFINGLDKNVKIYYNTRTGYIIVDNGGAQIYISNAGATYDGTNPLYAYYCIHKSGNTAVFNDFKCYDGEGNDLWFTTSMTYELPVTFKSNSIAVQPDNGGDNQDSRWLLYWTVKRVGGTESLLPSFNFNSTQPLYINGVETYPTNASSCYTFQGQHCWILYTKTVDNGNKNMRAMAPTYLAFEKGYSFTISNITYVVDEAFYVYFSGTHAEVSANAPISVSLKESATLSADDGMKRYHGRVSFVDGEGADVDAFNLYALATYLNSASGDRVIMSTDLSDTSNLFYYSTIQSGATTAGAITNKYFYLPAGSLVGAKYVLAEDIVIMINNSILTIFKAEEYTVTYEGLNDGDSHTNPTTFNYADGITDLEDPTYDTTLYNFLGWYIGDEKVTTLMGFTEDVTLTAKFEEKPQVPTVDSSAIMGRDYKLNAFEGQSNCNGTFANMNGMANADYIVVEWTNDDDGAPVNGGQTIYYGAGADGIHAYTIYGASVDALHAVCAANANVKIYFNPANGEVTALINDSTFYKLTSFTPVQDNASTADKVEDYTNTATPVRFCFHTMKAETVFNDVKIYAIKGQTLTDLKVNAGSRFALLGETAPTAVSNDVIGKDYHTTTGSKYISTVNATASEWIIFEMTTVSGETKINQAANDFHFGLGTASGNANATNVSVGDWSPINPLNNGGTVRYFINTKTGSIYVSTSDVNEVPVLTALTVGGYPSYTSINTGLETVYGKIYFNLVGADSNIMLYNVKAYDIEGNDLGIDTNIPVYYPSTDLAEDIAGVDLKLGSATGTIRNLNAPSDGARWIIFDWTNADSGKQVRGLSNDLHMGLTGNGSLPGFGNPTAQPAGVGTKISTYDARVRILVKLTTGEAFYEINGEITKFNTFTLPEGQNYVVGMRINGLTGTGYFRMNGLKVYDDKGKDLVVSKTGNWLDQELPTENGADITETVDAIFNRSCGGSGYFRYDNAVANATGAAVDAKWIIFEWTNGENNAVGTGNGSFLGVATEPSSTAHTKNNVAGLFTANKTNRLYISLETGDTYLEVDGGAYPFYSFGDKFPTELEEDKYIQINFGPHTFSGNVVLNDIKCYDDLGNDLGVKIGGNGAILETAPTVTSTATGIDYTVDGNSSCVYFESYDKTTSEWIIFEWTNGAENTWDSSVVSVRNNAMKMGISRFNGSAYHGAEGTFVQMDRILTADATVKLFFNTREGYMGYNVTGVTGESELHIIKTGLETSDGTTPVVAGFCFHTPVTGEFKNFKCYDGEGNDLGFEDNFIKTVYLNYEFAGFEADDDNVVGGVLDSRYFITWNVTNADNGRTVYPVFAIGDDNVAIRINGELVEPEKDSPCYTYMGEHTWILYTATIANGIGDMYQVAPVVLTIDEGTTFKNGNITYIINNDIEIYISGNDVKVGADSISDATISEETSFVYSANLGGFVGNLVLSDGTKIFANNVKAYKDGTEEVVLSFRKVEVDGVEKDLITVDELNGNDAKYFVIKAGDTIGNVYALTKDIVIQVNESAFNVFDRDKVFNISYVNLQGATTNNQKTFSYATDFNIALADLENVDGFVFNGWTIDGVEVTNITAGQYGHDIVVKAELTDGAEKVEILNKSNIAIYDSISLTFYVKVSVYDISELTANFKFTYSTEEAPKTKDGATFVEYQRYNDNTIVYQVTYDGILPQHLCDDVELKVLAGSTTIATFTTSVLDYCSALLAVTDPNVLNTDAIGLGLYKTLICDIVEYGSAMQEMISHDVANTPKLKLEGYDGSLATDFVSADGYDHFKKEGTYDENYYWKTAKLVYDTVPTLVFNFVAPASNNLSVSLTYEGLDAPIENSSIITLGDELYQARFFFPPTLFGQKVQLNIKDNGAIKGQTLYYSVNTYVARLLEDASVVAEEKETLKKIYNYGVSAKALKDYVDGKLYTVTFDLNGGYVIGNSCEPQSIAFGRIPTRPIENPTKEGYIFAGWDYDFASAIANDLVITAIWTARNDTAYTVEHYLPSASGYTLKDTVNAVGTTGESATAVVNKYMGYEFDEANTTLTAVVNADGSTVIKVYYEEIALEVLDGWKTYSDFSKTPIQTSIARNLDMEYVATTAINKYKLVYSADKPVLAKITIGEHTEDFYLEAGENVTFTSFTDHVLGDHDQIKAGIQTVHTAQKANYTAGDPMEEKVNGDGYTYTGEITITFEPITKNETVNFLPLQFATTYQEVEDKVIYIENNRFKIGTHLYYGGSLTYFEDKLDNRADIGNLVNIQDGGRLIQQSYYGTDDKANNNIGYNPVQGGNGYGYSKIIDFEVTETSIYVKARAKSWKDRSTYTLSASYMENWYILEDDHLRVDNTYVDFLEAENGDVSHETPAFYVVGALSTVAYYLGENPWTNDNLSYYKENMSLGDNAGKGGKFMQGGETWGAWLNPEGWGIGVYTPNATGFGSWVTVEGEGQDTYNPYVNATSYLTLNRGFNITQFEKVSYSYMVTTGEVQEIRDTFKEHKDFTVNEFPESFGDTYDFTNIDFTEKYGVDFTQRYHSAITSYDFDREVTKVAVTGGDPYFGISLLGASTRPLAEIYPYIAVEYMIPAEYADVTGKIMEIFVGVDKNEWVTGGRQANFNVVADGKWHVGYVDFSQHNWYSGTINMIRLDMPDVVGLEVLIKNVKLLETAPEEATYEDDYVAEARTWATKGDEVGNYQYACGDGSGVKDDQASYYAHGWFLVGDGINRFEYLVVESANDTTDYYKSAEAETLWKLAERTTTDVYAEPADARPNIGDNGLSASYGVQFPFARYMDGNTYKVYVRVVTDGGRACLFDSFTYTYVAPAE